MATQNEIDELRFQKISAKNHLIDGDWVSSSDEKTSDIFSPIDGSLITTIASGSVEDVDRAVSRARAVFESGTWSKMAPAGRKKILLKVADLIEKHMLELTVLGCRDNGVEFSMAYKAEAGSAMATFRYYAEAVDKVFGEIAPTANNILGLVHREPIGVVGAIVPWNFPMMIGAWKIAPALAAGNSVVLKPSEIASLALLRLGELCLEAGLPEGVLNIVTGEGRVVGQALGLHMDVDVLAFTGSGGTGRRLMEYSSRSNLKRLYLELGGKSPNIIFADAPDLNKAAAVSASAIFRNSGEVCVAASRLLVERSIHGEFLEKLIQNTKKLKVGDPLDLKSDVGAITSKEQLKADLGFVETAVNEGGRLVTGGAQLHADSGGNYMEPTIIDNVASDATLFQKEVFGPVLSVTPFDSEEEAVKLANATIFGLSSGVWTQNLSKAHRMIRSIRAGVVHVNTYGGSDLTVPLAGVGQSGNGADKSLHALDKYCDYKTAWIQL